MCNFQLQQSRWTLAKLGSRDWGRWQKKRWDERNEIFPSRLLSKLEKCNQWYQIYVTCTRIPREWLNFSCKKHSTSHNMPWLCADKQNENVITFWYSISLALNWRWSTLVVDWEYLSCTRVSWNGSLSSIIMSALSCLWIWVLNIH